MSKYLEFNGKNVDQALEKASDKLNLPAEKIKHEVLAYGSSGIFGLVGVKKAKIKVFIETQKETIADHKRDGEQLKEHATDTTPIVSKASVPEAVTRYDEDLVASGMKGLQTIIDEITDGATVQRVPKKDRLFFSITGGDSGVLIGKRGQTLEAMQYLLEKMINKKSASRIRVLVDVEGYLEKRKNNLQQMASRMAEKAMRTKKPVTLGQMNAHDRRIVHIHLKDEKSVRTQSIGDGYYRKLMIFPKKQAKPKRKHTPTKT